jgi:3-oxoacyl-[acyl-carrier-protein] synthase II
MGPITPIGTTRDEFWSGLQQQRSAVRSLTRFDPSQFRSHNAAEINDFVPGDHLDNKKAKRLDRFSQFSVVGAQMALADADLDLSKENKERIGANMGTALGGVSYAEGQLAVYLQQGLRAVDATLALAVFGGAASCNIAIELGVMGPNSTNAMSCASGTIAIGDAFRQIRDGYADVMVAGGAEAPLAPLCFGAFALIRAMSTRNEEPESASRPRSTWSTAIQRSTRSPSASARSASSSSRPGPTPSFPSGAASAAASERPSPSSRWRSSFASWLRGGASSRSAGPSIR